VKLPQDVTTERLLDAGRASGFPRLEIQRSEAVAAGETAWTTFVARASPEQIFRATAALLARGVESVAAWTRRSACGGV